mgnify:CR=1 FL=1
MKLITKEIHNKTPQLYTQDNVEDPIVYAKFFYPYGSATWLMLELDENNETAFGFVSLGLGEHNDELGYFNISELQKIGVERDVCFEPMKLSEAKTRYISLTPFERRLANLT